MAVASPPGVWRCLLLLVACSAPAQRFETLALGAPPGPFLFCIPGSGYIHGLDVDAAGDLAVAGRFGDDIDAGFVARYDALGQLRWVHERERPRGTDLYEDVVFTGDGGVVAVGVTVAPDTLVGVIDRLDAGGAVVWSLELDRGYSSVEAVAIAPDGDLAIAGVRRRELFVARLAPDGAWRWWQAIGDRDDDGRGEIDVAFDLDGGVVAAGHAGGAAFVMRTTADGELLWQHGAALADEELATADATTVAPASIAVTTDGTIVVAGGGGGGVADFGGNLVDVSTPAGFVAAFRPDGVAVWARSFASHSAKARAIAPAACGDVLVGGELTRRIDLGTGFLAAPTRHEGPYGFVARYTSHGGYLSARRTELGASTRTVSASIAAIVDGPNGPLAAISPGPGSWGDFVGCVVGAEPP